MPAPAVPSAARPAGIGRRFSLWRLQPISRDSGTLPVRCDLGCEHKARIVVASALVTVVETSDPVGEMGGTVGPGRGYRAVDDRGRSYYSDWKTFGDDYASRSHHYWQRKVSDGIVATYVDALSEANSPSTAYVRPDGTPAVPLGADRCEHHRWRLDGDRSPSRCPTCSRAAVLAARGLPAERPAGTVDTSWML